MEVLVYGTILLSVVGLIAYAFYLRGRVKMLEEWLAYFKADLPQWQNKALSAHGKTPLGTETKKRDSIDQKPPVKTVTRGELEQRYAEQEHAEEVVREQRSTSVTIHAEGVSNPKPPIVEKAREVINLNR